MSSYKIEGMTCNGCVDAVKRALERAIPDTQIRVKLEGGLIEIEGTHDEKQVAAAVEDAGFDFRGRIPG